MGLPVIGSVAHWIHILVQSVEYTLNPFCLYSGSNTNESLKTTINLLKIWSSWIWLRTWKLHSEYNHSVLAKFTWFQSRHHSPFVQHVSRGYMDWSPQCQCILAQGPFTLRWPASQPLTVAKNSIIGYNKDLFFIFISLFVKKPCTSYGLKIENLCAN